MSQVTSTLESLPPPQPLASKLAPVVAATPTSNGVNGIHTATERGNGNTVRSNLLPEFSLKDKVIVVSGGARGLGLVQVEACLEAGATVHALDRLPTPVNDATSEFFQVAQRARDELGASLSYHQIDVRNDVELNDIIKGIADQHGRMDGLIAAAGINKETPALEYSAKDVENMMSINFTGCFVTAQAVARQMVRFGQGGSILMVASMSAGIANKGMIAPIYNPSKAAVAQLARNLASEWGVHGIRVNTLSPGYILTQMLENLFVEYPERRTKWPQENMLGRLSLPKEYRGAAVFLLSDASSFMTGADLRIDGGHSAW